MQPILRGLFIDAMLRWTEKSVTKVFEDYKPDLIISVHPLAQDIPLKILKRINLQIPFVTVVTDLISIHPLWLHSGVHLCFIASDEAYQYTLQAGLQPSQLRQYGLPVRPSFISTPQPKQQLRQKFGMPLDLPAVLIIGGGQGVGPITEIASKVANRLVTNSGPIGQVIIICGHNHRLKEKLLTQNWSIPIVINGFVDNISDWMTASDCIITKAGPGTIAEALIRELPILLSGHIPGQEEGNVTYVVENNLGVYSENPEEIAAIVSCWFSSTPSKLDQFRKQSQQMARPQAVFHIVEDIARLLDNKP